MTGILIGFELGVALYALVSGPRWLFALHVSWLVVLEVAVAFAMYRAGSLEPYICRYERAVYLPQYPIALSSGSPDSAEVTNSTL